jgi:hypothetical protein
MSAATHAETPVNKSCRVRVFPQHIYVFMISSNVFDDVQMIQRISVEFEDDFSSSSTFPHPREADEGVVREADEGDLIIIDETRAAFDRAGVSISLFRSLSLSLYSSVFFSFSLSFSFSIVLY